MHKSPIWLVFFPQNIKGFGIARQMVLSTGTARIIPESGPKGIAVSVALDLLSAPQSGTVYSFFCRCWVPPAVSPISTGGRQGREPAAATVRSHPSFSSTGMETEG